MWQIWFTFHNYHLQVREDHTARKLQSILNPASLVLELSMTMLHSPLGTMLGDPYWTKYCGAGPRGRVGSLEKKIPLSCPLVTRPEHIYNMAWNPAEGPWRICVLPCRRKRLCIHSTNTDWPPSQCTALFSSQFDWEIIYTNCCVSLRWIAWWFHLQVLHNDHNRFS